MGIAERVELAGGELTYGPAPTAASVLRATLPWMTPVRVLLVDDDPLLRSGLKLMLAPEERIEVVAEAGDGDEVLAAIDRHRPDVVLMDIRMARLDGIAATRLVRAQAQAPAVIVLTTFDADELVVRGLEAGAVGFLLKDSSPAEIVEAILHVHAGEGMLSPSVARQLIAMVAGDGEAGERRAAAAGGWPSSRPRELRRRRARSAAAPPTPRSRASCTSASGR